MRIAILIEGGTELAFKPYLHKFLLNYLSGKMPTIEYVSYDGPIPRGKLLRNEVKRLLADRKKPADAVIALTDVYTGKTPIFSDANQAKRKMREWAGATDRFYPHAAQYEFEAWLLPFWNTIAKLAGSNKKPPSAQPENVNHDRPPSHLLKEIFHAGSTNFYYNKIRDAGRILRDNDLLVSVNACPELKSFINTILTLSGGSTIA